MNRIFTSILLICLTATFGRALSQQIVQVPVPVNLYDKSFLTKNAAIQLKELKQNGRLVSLNFNADRFRKLSADENRNLQIEIPGIGDLPIELELSPVTITSDDFSVTNTADKNQTEAILDKSIFYRGKVKGDERSLASLSFVNDELSGMIIDSTGTRIIGKNQDKASNTDAYILYYENDLTADFQFLCNSVESDLIRQKGLRSSQLTGADECKYLRVYIETDKSVYDKLGSKANVTAYVLGLFNQVATIFNAEHIAFRISGLYIWDTADPYTSPNNLDDALNVFQSYWNGKNNNFPGQFAHLLTCRPLGGGNANMEAMDDRSKAYGVNGIYGNYKIVPAYSWDVKVFAHELGHNLGSPHTHSCSWPGGAIDNCTTVEGNCAPGPTPVNGGTIMSYCQNTSIGINLALGFGPLPGNLIRSRIAANATLPVSNNTPSDLLSYNIAGRSAQIKWSFSGASTNHTIQYKAAVSSASWIEIQTTKDNILLSNLTPNTEYYWKVKGNCSDFTALQSFTTNTSQPPYCQPSDVCTKQLGIGLNAVSINNMSLSSGSDCAAGGYTFNSSSPVPQLTVGQSYSFNFALLAYSFPQYVKAWIDYNNDGEFTTNEIIAESASALTAAFSGTFKVPDNQIALTTRMRIRTNYFYKTFSSCENLSLGETEDYIVNFAPATPLPVKFISVGVLQKNHNAVLNWQTVDEDLGFYFDIQKSREAKNFENIGKIKGNGPSVDSNMYQFSDEIGDENSKILYYRIRMPNGQGGYEYSRIVALNLNVLSESVLKVWPNPFQENFRLALKTYNKGSIRLAIFNENGTAIKVENKSVKVGENTFEIKDMRNLPVGQYILKIDDGQDSYSNILIKSP